MKYKPGIVMGKKYLVHDCGVNCSIGYFLEPLIVLGLFGKKSLAIRLRSMRNYFLWGCSGTLIVKKREMDLACRLKLLGFDILRPLLMGCWKLLLLRSTLGLLLAVKTLKVFLMVLENSNQRLVLLPTFRLL